MNLITGMVFFVATPHQYTGFLFFLKMVLVVFGAFNVLYFMLSEEPWKIGEGRDAPINHEACRRVGARDLDCGAVLRPHASLPRQFFLGG